MPLTRKSTIRPSTHQHPPPNTHRSETCRFYLGHLGHVRSHVEHSREGEVVGELDRCLPVPVKVEALQVEAHHWWESVDGYSLHTAPLHVTPLAVVRIVTFQYLSSEEFALRFQHIPRFHRQTYGTENLFAVEAGWKILGGYAERHITIVCGNESVLSMAMDFNFVCLIFSKNVQFNC